MSIPLLVVVIVISILILLFALMFVFNKINPKISRKHLKFFTKKYIIEYHNEGNETPYLIKKNLDGSISDDEFRVVCCADLHLATEECEFGLTVLDRLIDKTQPDLLVLLGDNACDRDDTFIEDKLIKLFEKKKLHYAFILGNHDSEYLINKETSNIKNLDKETYEKIRKKYRIYKFENLMRSKYCVSYLKDLNISGVGNYSINIKNSKGVIKTLYFMDSGDYAFGVKRKDFGTEKRCYDYIHEDQLEWYKNQVNKNKVDSIVFIHIPLKEYWNAYKLSLLPFYNFRKQFGNNYEKPCSSDIPSNAFKEFKENHTKIVVAGHDHKNDSCINYKGVKLMYSQGLQYDGAYNRRKKNPKLFRLLYKHGIKCYIEGVSVFDITKDKVNIIPVYAEKEEVFDGLERYYKRAWLEGTYKSK